MGRKKLNPIARFKRSFRKELQKDLKARSKRLAIARRMEIKYKRMETKDKRRMEIKARKREERDIAKEVERIRKKTKIVYESHYR